MKKASATGLPKIESGIPIPERNERGLTDLIRQMKIGYSALFCGDDAHARFHATAKQIGMSVMVRKQPDGRVRVWRVK